MGKQYELLAVEPDLRQRAGVEVKRLASLFKTGSFVGQLISYHPVLEGELEVPEERVELITTVGIELAQFEKIFGDYMDVSLQKELTNSNAQAEVNIDGLKFDLSATALLNLQSKLEDLRKLYMLLPTLDPTESWEFDKEQGVFISGTRLAYRRKKEMKSFVAYEATKEHAAQVETFTEDVPTHRRETVISSGAISVADKRKRIARIDNLLVAVKKARQRANDIDAVDVKLSDDIFAYINQE